MNNADILIIEDEQIIAQNLKMILNNLGYEKVYVEDGLEEVMEVLNSRNVDLILADINLNNPKLDGIDLIFKIQNEYIIPHIFITANADEKTVERAKETKPKGFIVKPFNKQTIYTNVALALFDEDKSKLEYSDKNGKSFVKINQVVYCEADTSYVKLFLSNGDNVLIRDSLRNLEQSFPDVFIRIHRSRLVNVNHVDSYTSSKVMVKGVEFTVGRVFKESFIHRLS